MKIGLLTLQTAEIKSYADIARRNKQDYCDRHGYRLIVAESHDSSRPAAWTKIPLLLQHLSDFDWMFWTDADSVITNPDVRLEEFLNPWSDLIITRDCYHINAGEYFLRNCEWSFRFLNEAWAQKDLIHHGWWDQAAMIRLYPKHFTHFSILPPRAFNSYENNWQPGDFLIHFPGTSTTHRFDRIRTFDSYARDTSKPAHLRVAQRQDFPNLLNRLDLNGKAVEVGATCGNFARHLLEKWRGSCLHLFDTRPIPSVKPGNCEDVDEHRHNAFSKQLKGYETRCLVHRCSKAEATQYHGLGVLDFVYLNANIASDATLEDLRDWYRRIRAGGILAGQVLVKENHAGSDSRVPSAVIAFAKQQGVMTFYTHEIDRPSWYLFKNDPQPKLT